MLFLIVGVDDVEAEMGSAPSVLSTSTCVTTMGSWRVKSCPSTRMVKAGT